MFSAGIIDPTKVARLALQNAASVSALMLTTEAMVAEAPKKKGAGMPAMPPGGGMPPGMGVWAAWNGRHGLLITLRPMNKPSPPGEGFFCSVTASSGNKPFAIRPVIPYYVPDFDQASGRAGIRNLHALTGQGFSPTETVTKTPYRFGILLLILLTLIPWVQPSAAYSEAAFPSPRGAVNDFADVIPAQYKDRMENLAPEVLEKTGPPWS
jgi:hypothetical protein